MATASTVERPVELPPVIKTRLEDIRRRDSRFRLLRGLADAASLFVAVVFIALLLDWAFTFFSTEVRMTVTFVALGAGGVGLLLLAALPQLKRRELSEVAGEVDRTVSALEERWQTVTEITAAGGTGPQLGSNRMIEKVVEEAVAGEQLVDSREVVTNVRLKKRLWVLGAMVLVHLSLFLIDGPQAWVLMQRFWSPASPVCLTQVRAIPGDVVVSLGDTLRLEASLSRRPRKKAVLFFRDSQGRLTDRALTATDDAGERFAYTIDAVEESFDYKFRAGDGETGWHHVIVFERPTVTRVDFRLQPPEYTGFPETVKSQLPVKTRAVEGTRLQIAFFADQPLKQFRLDLGKDESVMLSPQGDDSNRYVFRTTLEKTLVITPRLISEHGLKNDRPSSCRVIVYPDRAPQVRIVKPKDEISLTPDDEVIVEIAARDDFGVVRAELIAFTGDAPDFENATVLPPEPKQAPATGQPPADKAPTSDASSPSAAATPAGRNDPVPTGTTAQSPGGQSSEGNPPGANSNNARQRSTPSQTVVVPIPLGDQADRKNVRATVKLDLKKLGLKHGGQLKYMVRVYDSRNSTSLGRPQGDKTEPSPQKLTKSDPRPVQKPSGDTKNVKGKKPNSPTDASSPSSGGSEQDRQPNTDSASKTTPRKPAGRSDAKSTKPDGSSQTNDRTAQSPSKANESPSKANESPSKANESPSKANESPSKANESSSQPNSSSASPGSATSDPPPESQKKSTSAPRPQDKMTRRRLDVDSQSAISSTMRIHIDEWAGSFKGQQRKKVEVLIDPVLKQLDAALAKSLEHLSPVADALKQGRELGDELHKPLRAAETRIALCESLVGDLVKRSNGTPYAFIGLQLIDITRLHIAPAGNELKSVRDKTADKPLAHIAQAEFHLKRARELLANLTRKYETVKRDAKLADDMQRIRKMYQIFIEDSLGLLNSPKPVLNPKNRKMAELELDEEFLEQYTELQKRWHKILAELAKALADDPRLLERYMNSSRRSAVSLRDQLTLIHNRQKLLLPVTEQLILGGAAPLPKADAKPGQGSPKERKTPAVAAFVFRSLQRDSIEIAGSASDLQENLTTWLPLALDPKDERIVPLQQQAVRVAATATQAAAAIAKPDGLKPATVKVNALVGQLETFETGLAALAEKEADAPLTVHANRRLARVRRLQIRASSWREKAVIFLAERFHRALELDQHRLAEETLELAGKLEGLDAQLAGLPPDISDLVGELNEMLRFDVSADQMSAELSLRDNRLPAARKEQKNALEHLSNAETLFDKLIDRIIEEGDKVPPVAPNLDELQLPTLEELLARLENETDLAEMLGVPNRPTNLQQFRDWLSKNTPGGGMNGNGMTANARLQAQLAEQARQNALRAIRKTAAADLDGKPAEESARWNTLPSRLQDVLRQGRGNNPPKQYRRAIERYFELISDPKSEAGSSPPKTRPSGRRHPAVRQ